MWTRFIVHLTLLNTTDARLVRRQQPRVAIFLFGPAFFQPLRYFYSVTLCRAHGALDDVIPLIQASIALRVGEKERGKERETISGSRQSERAYFSLDWQALACIFTLAHCYNPLIVSHSISTTVRCYSNFTTLHTIPISASKYWKNEELLFFFLANREKNTESFFSGISIRNGSIGAAWFTLLETSNKFVFNDLRFLLIFFRALSAGRF